MTTSAYKILLLLFLLSSPLGLYAQQEDDEVGQEIPNNVSETPKRFQWSKAFIGGNAGASFGNEIYVDISPDFGYFVHPRVAIAVGAIYQYYNDRINNFKTSVYGGRTFVRYYPLDMLFLHGEAELLNLEGFLIVDRGRLNVGSIPLGVGYAQRFGSNGTSAFNIMLLYDVLQNQYSPYGKRPIIRMGFGVGL